MAQLSFQGQGTLLTGTVAIDLASIAASAIGEHEASVANAAVGDIVILTPPSGGLNADLVVCDARCSGAGKIKVRVFNAGTGAVNNAEVTFNYLLLRA